MGWRVDVLDRFPPPASASRFSCLSRLSRLSRLSATYQPIGIALGRLSVGVNDVSVSPTSVDAGCANAASHVPYKSSVSRVSYDIDIAVFLALLRSMSCCSAAGGQKRT